MSDPPGHLAPVKSDERAPRRQQILLTLPVQPAPAPRQPRPCNRERADWWFRQMRRVVDQGLDYRAPGVF
jgi:hypothetical protein